MMTDDKFLDKANKFFIAEDVSNKKKDSAEQDIPVFYTLDEYKKETESQKNKEGKHVILYTTNPVQQDAYIQAAIQKGYKIVKMETLVDAAFINTMESKWNDTHFVRVDSDIVDNLIDKQDKKDSVLSKEEAETLKKLFTIEEKDMHLTVDVAGLSTDSAPVIATRPEFMRRMKDMASVGGGGMASFYANMHDEVNVTINGNHPIYQQILKQIDQIFNKNKLEIYWIYLY